MLEETGEVRMPGVDEKIGFTAKRHDGRRDPQAERFAPGGPVCSEGLKGRRGRRGPPIVGEVGNRNVFYGRGGVQLEFHDSKALRRGSEPDHMNQKLQGAEGGRLVNVENRDADRRPTTADEAGTLAGEIVGVFCPNKPEKRLHATMPWSMRTNSAMTISIPAEVSRRLKGI